LKLLIETQPTTIHKEKGKLILLGKYIVSETVNRNKRFYSAKTVSEAVDAVQDKIRAGQLFGMLGHPTDAGGDLSRVSHVVKSLQRHGNDWIGRSEVLGEGAGKIADSPGAC
jgi:hypothetical protein